MHHVSILLLLLVLGYINPVSAQYKFSSDAVLEDLDYLYQSLEEVHCNLYAYTSKEAFKANYLKQKQSVAKDSMDLLSVYNLFQKVTSSVNNGHTEIDFPIVSYSLYAQTEGSTLFPLELSFEQNKNIVRKNFSANKSIPIGAELLSINGMSIEDVLAKIYLQISAERLYLKHAKIELYSFPRYYWQVFGQQDQFEVELLINQKKQTLKLDAVPLIAGYEMVRNEVMNASMQLKFLPNAAYLNPGDLSGDEARYQRFIDSAFVQIKAQNAKNLVIDLRNNRGGDDSFSDYLVSYIANKPFHWHKNLTVKSSALLKQHTRENNDTIEMYFQKILSQKNGKTSDFTFDALDPQPKEKRFQGKVYVLVNRQSHSMAAVTAAQIQDYKFGTIVGEETGDYPSLYAAQFFFSLPNTGIVVKAAKGFITRVNGNKATKGVQPDIVIQDHLLDETDEILEGLMPKLKE